AFESRASVRTWLIGILKNKIIDFLRKSRREVNFEPDAYDDGDMIAKFDERGHWPRAPADWGDPAKVAENEALASTMSDCIEHLPEKLRAPFVLREIDGLSSAEVIETLGISTVNNLWVILSRGRERVRKCVESNWFGGARK
ncbi:MAG: sigma-70 family RNA polymerase sigma factor, partial [Gammaproteobacteria bacterium]